MVINYVFRVEIDIVQEMEKLFDTKLFELNKRMGCNDLHPSYPLPFYKKFYETKSDQSKIVVCAELPIAEVVKIVREHQELRSKNDQSIQYSLLHNRKDLPTDLLEAICDNSDYSWWTGCMSPSMTEELVLRRRDVFNKHGYLLCLLMENASLCPTFLVDNFAATQPITQFTRHPKFKAIYDLMVRNGASEQELQAQLSAAVTAGHDGLKYLGQWFFEREENRHLRESLKVESISSTVVSDDFITALVEEFPHRSGDVFKNQSFTEELVESVYVRYTQNIRDSFVIDTPLDSHHSLETYASAHPQLSAGFFRKHPELVNIESLCVNPNIDIDFLLEFRHHPKFSISHVLRYNTKLPAYMMRKALRTALGACRPHTPYFNGARTSVTH